MREHLWQLVPGEAVVVRGEFLKSLDFNPDHDGLVLDPAPGKLHIGPIQLDDIDFQPKAFEVGSEIGRPLFRGDEDHRTRLRCCAHNPLGCAVFLRHRSDQSGFSARVGLTFGAVMKPIH
jgi:hypothetical protein